MLGLFVHSLHLVHLCFVKFLTFDYLSSTSGLPFLLYTMLPSPRSSQSPNAGRVPPVKLRSACNQCCAAKVKCSGEKSGCERCRNTGAQCIYLESKVGKVPGIRAKKKQLHSQGPEPSQKPATASHRSETPITVTSDVNSSPDHGQDDSTGWTAGWNFNTTDETANLNVDLHASTEESSVSPGATMDFPSNEEYPLVALEGSLEEFLMAQGSLPSSSAEQVQQVVPLTHRPASVEIRHQKQLDSQCCVECCKIISELESYIAAELKVLKIVLVILRGTLEKVAHLIELQQSSKNPRCLTLFSTLMYQVLELLEVCLSIVIDENHSQRSHSLIWGSTGLGVGDFSLESEDQSASRTQKIAITKIVRQAIEALGKLQDLAGARQDLFSTNQTNTVYGNRRDCYADLEYRFKELTVRSAREG
ncbi:hypothetical protein F4813DRAFT_372600 [Daldinia decipiens]|uniref:uncharacterized protein n=1 Tax=Daldinia decipiens TaxID=326647 RepID=UPI0020C5958A|nr:uncharacterized protein F4813DRAFT_372600 [Daldinia decipiens]KAI1653956.1 hypothetical protein F4813DRAFT_372600 [Daldinia decipiens]